MHHRRQPVRFFLGLLPPTSNCKGQDARDKRAKRDKHMSEQKQSFRQQPDEWTETTVTSPLLSSGGEPDEFVGGETVEQIQKAVRGKALESYRNGQAAGPRQAVAAVRR